MTDGRLTRRPATASSVMSATAAVVAVLATATTSIGGLGAGLVGAVVLIVALVRGYRSLLDVGCLVLFVGVVVGGLEGGTVEVALVGTVATVVAWDVGQAGIDVGDQLGREAETTRLELVHVVSSVLVGTGTVAVAYAVYAVAADRQPVAAVVLLLVAATLVTLGLGTRRKSKSRRAGVGPR